MKYYNELKRIGIWDYLSGLEKSIFNIEQVLGDAVQLLKVQTADGLIEFAISRIFEKFVPEHLLFVFEVSANFNPEVYYFRRLSAAAVAQPVCWYNGLKECLPEDESHFLFARERGRFSDSLIESLGEYRPNIIVPMKGLEGVFGFVLFSDKVTNDAYTEGEISYLNRFIPFFSVCLQNTLHHRSSITDLKTGLFNHAYFMRRLEEELFRGRRYKSETAVLLMDIDFFKSLNDTHGHLAGDLVLQKLAENMKEKLRIEDILSRFGGEEFILLLPGTHMPTALEIAERLRRAVESLRVQYGDRYLSITISLGCAFSTPADPLPPQELIARADKALYMSKENGRNRVTLYTGQDVQSPSGRS
ncbi:MAG: GGDEF domain-containing protein [Spirochaetales bacterium]|nr:GGDEF domain-containing protein [Spirochaetales bacterium]